MSNEIREYEEEGARVDAINRMILDYKRDIDWLKSTKNEYRLIAVLSSLVALAAMVTIAMEHIPAVIGATHYILGALK